MTPKMNQRPLEGLEVMFHQMYPTMGNVVVAAKIKGHLTSEIIHKAAYRLQVSNPLFRSNVIYKDGKAWISINEPNKEKLKLTIDNNCIHNNTELESIITEEINRVLPEEDGYYLVVRCIPTEVKDEFFVLIGAPHYLIDGVACELNLDIFIRHCDKLYSGDNKIDTYDLKPPESIYSYIKPWHHFISRKLIELVWVNQIKKYKIHKTEIQSKPQSKCLVHYGTAENFKKLYKESKKREITIGGTFFSSGVLACEEEFRLDNINFSVNYDLRTRSKASSNNPCVCIGIASLSYNRKNRSFFDCAKDLNKVLGRAWKIFESKILHVISDKFEMDKFVKKHKKIIKESSSKANVMNLSSIGKYKPTTLHKAFSVKNVFIATGSPLLGPSLIFFLINVNGQNHFSCTYDTEVISDYKARSVFKKLVDRMEINAYIS